MSTHRAIIFLMVVQLGAVAVREQVLKLRRDGLTLREIAARVGVTHQRVHQIDRDAEPFPTIKTKRNADGSVTVQAQDVDAKTLETRIIVALRRRGDDVKRRG